MKKTIILFMFFCSYIAEGQELYVFSEPASNMPAKSLSLKLGTMYGKDIHAKRILQRYMPEVMFGLSKNWMMHTSFTFSNMHQRAFIFESARLYAKWRFLSVDDIHKHFRMAAFGAAAYSRNHLDHNEINLMGGDQSGIQGGLIATQLWNKLAISGNVSINEILDEQRRLKTLPAQYAFSSVNYSLSAGYLVLPKEYTSYDQTNLNFYLEMLGSRNLSWPGDKFYVDLAPAIQIIFKSNSKLNIGYRFQVAGDIYRLMDKSLSVSYEHTFLNALKKKRNDRNSY
jgi:hypothetical protein